MIQKISQGDSIAQAQFQPTAPPHFCQHNTDSGTGGVGDLGHPHPGSQAGVEAELEEPLIGAGMAGVTGQKPSDLGSCNNRNSFPHSLRLKSEMPAGVFSPEASLLGWLLLHVATPLCMHTPGVSLRHLSERIRVHLAASFSREYLLKALPPNEVTLRHWGLGDQHMILGGHSSAHSRGWASTCRDKALRPCRSQGFNPTPSLRTLRRWREGRLDGDLGLSVSMTFCSSVDSLPTNEGKLWLE